MLTHTDLKKGTKFILNKEPYEVSESSFLVKGRGSSVVQIKIKNLNNGNVISKTVHPGEEFEEVEIEKVKAKFLYSHPDRKSSISNGASRNRYYFCEEDNPNNRFNLTEEQIGSQAKFLKVNQLVEAMIFDNKVINVSLPIKIQLKVKEAPPGVKGNRAQAGTKIITLETGAKINAPLFIEEGDIVEINTETDEYVRRIE